MGNNFNSNLALMYSQPGYFIKSLAFEEYYVPESSSLYDTVYSFYEARPREKEVNIPVIPDGCIDMVISFSEKQCTGISVCGTITSYYSMTMKNSDYIFGVRFKPGKFPFSAEGEVKEIVDNQKYLVISYREWNFIKEMMEAKSFRARVLATSKYIEDKIIHKNSYSEKLVSYTMDCINNTNGNISIKNISSELLYSTRYIERVFKEYTGFTPKKMCKYARMHKAVNYLLSGENLNHTYISMECGYSDLSHMNRDLKEIIGLNSTKINQVDFFNLNTKVIDTVYKF